VTTFYTPCQRSGTFQSFLEGYWKICCNVPEICVPELWNLLVFFLKHYWILLCNLPGKKGGSKSPQLFSGTFHSFSHSARPILTYCFETWAMIKSHENLLATFERKVLRKIFGAVNVNGTWRHRYNFEIYKIYKEADVITYIKVNRIWFAGHICRMDPSSTTSKIFNHRPLSTRRRGRQKLRRVDCIDEDFKILKTSNGRTFAKRRTTWRKILKKALAHKGLSCQ